MLCKVKKKLYHRKRLVYKTEVMYIYSHFTISIFVITGLT